MDLSMTGVLAAAYKSGSQSARIVTETWGAANFYCANCTSANLNWLRAGHKVSDYSCPLCGLFYQLKSQRAPLGNTINDGDYRTMKGAVENDATPSFYFMQYDFATWSIRNLLLVPHFAFPPSAIIKRNPTLPKGRSKPWIGCNIALNRIPIEARIDLVKESKITPPPEVREKFSRVKPLERISVSKRGWMLEVLAAVRSLNKKEFTNQDLYALEPRFQQLHPENKHIRDKIRQQLQYLAAAGFIHHPGRNNYQLKSID